MINKKIAIFFDSDNISASYIEQIYKILESYGTIYIAKSYMDWTIPQANEWKNKIHNFGIEAIQVFPNTKEKPKGQKKENFKNASDIKITIDVCDLINTSKIDLIVIVSSDSDYTSLAFNIRSKLLDCIIFGEFKAPPALRNACTKFIQLPIKKNKKSANTKEVDILIKILHDIDENEFSKIGKILQDKYAHDYTHYFNKKRWTKILDAYPQLFEVMKKNGTATVKLK
jgi:uncharacterized LabA/DUF88 family protein